MASLTSLCGGGFQNSNQSRSRVAMSGIGQPWQTKMQALNEHGQSNCSNINKAHPGLAQIIQKTSQSVFGRTQLYNNRR